jgi:hypothetical protein
LDRPRRLWELVPGLLAAGLFVFFMVQEKRQRKIFRTLSYLIQSFLGLFFGSAGFLLFFLSFFTDHDYTYHNSNVIFVNPLLLAAVPLGIICALSGGGRFRTGMLLKALWTYVFLGGVISMAIKCFPGFYQQNQATQALVLPFAFVLSFFPGWLAKPFRLKTKRGIKPRCE